jgi:hypothetical protein
MFATTAERILFMQNSLSSTRQYCILTWTEVLQRAISEADRLQEGIRQRTKQIFLDPSAIEPSLSDKKKHP